MKKNWLLGLLVCGVVFGADEKEASIKLGATVQAWLFNDTTATAARPNFRLRRAELKFGATVAETAKFFVMIDPTKAISTSSTTVVTATTPATTTTTVKGVNTSGDTKIIQDLGIVISLMPDLDVTLGQFKTPTTAEGLDSSAELLLPDRSLVGRTFGDKREPGGMISYKNSGFKGMVMFSNGGATNVDDTDNNKDLSLRGDYEIMPEAKVGAFMQATNFSFANMARWGLNARYITDTLSVKAEGVYQSTLNDSVKTLGLMSEFVYTFEKIQPVFRFEYFRPNTNNELSGKAVNLGVNYYINKHKAKVQFAYTYLIDMTAANGTTAIASAAGVRGSVLYLVFAASL